MFAALNEPSDLIRTVCRLPRVVTVMLALKPAALATTWIEPLLPVPWIVPLILRLISLQPPVIWLPSAVTLVRRSNL